MIKEELLLYELPSISEYTSIPFLQDIIARISAWNLNRKWRRYQRRIERIASLKANPVIPINPPPMDDKTIEAHKTIPDWCCACDADQAFMRQEIDNGIAQGIEKQKSTLLKEIREWAEREMEGGHVDEFGEGFDKAIGRLQDFIKSYKIN